MWKKGPKFRSGNAFLDHKVAQQQVDKGKVCLQLLCFPGIRYYLDPLIVRKITVNLKRVLNMEICNSR